MTTRHPVADGSSLAVTITGTDEGPVVLLAHGVGSSSRFLQRAFARDVHAAGWRLATVDLRGHGGSDPDDDPAHHTVAAHAADLADVAAGVGAEVIGGVSIGGHAAVLAAARCRPRAVLACLPAWTNRTAPGVGPHAAVAAAVRAAGIPSFVAGVAADTTMAPWLRDTVVSDFRRCDEASLAAALLALDGASGPDHAALGSLPCPLAVVGWPDDPGHPLAVAEEWAGHAGGSLATLRIEDVQGDRGAMGAAAMRALAEVGVSPRR